MLLAADDYSAVSRRVPLSNLFERGRRSGGDRLPAWRPRSAPGSADPARPCLGRTDERACGATSVHGEPVSCAPM